MAGRVAVWVVTERGVRACVLLSRQSCSSREREVNIRSLGIATSAYVNKPQLGLDARIINFELEILLGRSRLEAETDVALSKIQNHRGVSTGTVENSRVACDMGVS